MTDTPEGSAQETFISHLVELRDRLLRAIIAVVVVMPMRKKMTDDTITGSASRFSCW